MAQATIDDIEAHRCPCGHLCSFVAGLSPPANNTIIALPSIVVPAQKSRAKSQTSLTWPGVRLGRKGYCWRAEWTVNGKKVGRAFSIRKHGNEGARLMAIQARKDAMK